ncbi:MAG: TIGR02466 family protein [Nevskiaceae bacterium]
MAANRIAPMGRSHIELLFPTLVYAAPLGAGTGPLNRELLKECRAVRARDAAGRRWSARGYPGGYTSYGSLDQVHRLSSTFIRLRERIDRQVAAYARALHWDLRGGRLAMSDCWINMMGRGAVHGLHLHPQAVVSGTYYVKAPAGSAGLKLEDPRLARFMAAPMRRARAPRPLRLHVEVPARAGHLVLFESWLRHEVPAGGSAAERVSLSFNYHWAPAP